MEIIAVFFVVFLIWIIFKILGAVFYTGAFLITLPIKIIFSIFVLLFLIPLGILGVFAGLIGIIVPLFPFLLLGLIVAMIIRKR